jgi:hypothetical protein
LRPAIHRRAALLLLCLPLSGCGLADYESQMRETQARLQELDHTNKLLDEPVVVPGADLFLRPPRGIQKAPEGEPRDGFLFHYPTRGSGAGPFLFVEVAVAEAKRPDFAAEVLRHYPAAGQVLAFAPGTPRPVDHRTPPKFDTHEFDGDEATYSVNVYKGEKAQVAVTFAIARGQRAAADVALNHSLKSLAFGPDADRLRREYKTPPWRLTAPER